MSEPITKNMFIGEVVEKYPQTIEILLDTGVHCVGCHISHFETLEQGLMGHGALSVEEVDKVIEDMNKAVKESVEISNTD